MAIPSAPGMNSGARAIDVPFLTSPLSRRTLPRHGMGPEEVDVFIHSVDSPARLMPVRPRT
jgi:hypothetical protein